MSDDARRTTATLARGGVLSVAGTGVNTLASFALTVLIARAIPGTQLDGAFFSAIALFSIVSRIGMLGANTGLVKFLASSTGGTGVATNAGQLLRIAVTPVALLSVVMSVAGWVFSEQLAAGLSSPDVAADFAGIVRRFSLFLPAATVGGLYLGASRGWSSMVPTAVYESIFLPVGQLALVAMAFLLSLGTQAAATAYWAPWVVVLVLAIVWVHRRLPPTPRPATRAPWRPFWGFALPRAAARILSFLLARLDVLMLGALATSAAAGIYTASIRFIGVGLALQWALYQPMEPEIARLLAHHSREETEAQFHAMTCWTVLVTWPLLLTLMVHGRPLLRLFGPEYVAGHSVLVILASTLLLATAIGGIEVVLIMAGHTGWSLVNVAVALALNIGLNLVLIPRMGIDGAAIAWSISIVVNNVLPLLQVRRWVGVQPFNRAMALAGTIAVVSFGVVGLAARAVLGSSLPGAVATGLVSLAIWSALVFLARERLRVTELVRAVRP